MSAYARVLVVTAVAILGMGVVLVGGSEAAPEVLANWLWWDDAGLRYPDSVDWDAVQDGPQLTSLRVVSKIAPNRADYECRWSGDAWVGQSTTPHRTGSYTWVCGHAEYWFASVAAGAVTVPCVRVTFPGGAWGGASLGDQACFHAEYGQEERHGIHHEAVTDI